MNIADFNELDNVENRHFYKCKQCGEMVDKRQLDDVLFHEDHVHRPDIQYTRLGGTVNSHLYEVLPRKDKRGVNLISDALPFGRWL
jgi:hypothetical protein